MIGRPSPDVRRRVARGRWVQCGCTHAALPILAHERAAVPVPLTDRALHGRTKAEKELRDGARDLERKKQELQDDSNAKRNDEVGKLQRSLMTEVRDYAKAQNYDIVIAEGVIYATPAVDITPAVLAALQARAPKAPAGGSPAPAKPAAKP